MNRECELCGKNMDIFVSENKKVIFMCPCCGFIYLPNNTRNTRVTDYVCNYGCSFEPSGDMATIKQASYLKGLANQLNINLTNIYALSRIEVNELISRLKEEVETKCCFINGKRIKIEEEIDDEYFVIGRNNDKAINKSWVEKFKKLTHPNDQWTKVNVETYLKNIKETGIDEVKHFVKTAYEENAIKDLIT